MVHANTKIFKILSRFLIRHHDYDEALSLAAQKYNYIDEVHWWHVAKCKDNLEIGYVGL